MRPFRHIRAASVEEASALLQAEGGVALAGGGDLLGALKDNILPDYPRTVVSLGGIPGLRGIREEDGALTVGALTTLAELSRDPLVLARLPLLAQAAGAAASPNLRESATVGGNLCQLPRCWYFRKLNNRFDCARKGGERCFALTGDDRYHSVFGGERFEVCPGTQRVCIAAYQGDLAPVLGVLGAVVVTTRRSLPIEEFLAVGVLTATVLERGELVTALRLPLAETPVRGSYRRFTFRKSIDFPVVSVAIAADAAHNYRICLGGVSPLPRRAEAAEALLKGKALTPELAEAAGLAAAEGARPGRQNAYKVQLIKALVKRELLAL